MSNITDSQNPNVQLLYEIIGDFVDQNDLTVVELMGIFEVIKIEQVLCSRGEDGDETDSTED